jgi:hypothetical protein
VEIIDEQLREIASVPGVIVEPIVEDQGFGHRFGLQRITRPHDAPGKEALCINGAAGRKVAFDQDVPEGQFYKSSLIRP